MLFTVPGYRNPEDCTASVEIIPSEKGGYVVLEYERVDSLGIDGQWVYRYPNYAAAMRSAVDSAVMMGICERISYNKKGDVTFSIVKGGRSSLDVFI